MGRLYTKSLQDTTTELLKELEELVPESGLGISDKERVMIVKAMGLGQGHWFKCPQGKSHFQSPGETKSREVELGCLRLGGLSCCRAVLERLIFGHCI